jgi:hypothetical protein
VQTDLLGKFVLFFKEETWAGLGDGLGLGGLPALPVDSVGGLLLRELRGVLLRELLLRDSRVGTFGVNGSLHALPQLVGQCRRRSYRRGRRGSGLTSHSLWQLLATFFVCHQANPLGVAHIGQCAPHGIAEHRIGVIWQYQASTKQSGYTPNR